MSEMLKQMLLATAFASPATTVVAPHAVGIRWNEDGQGWVQAPPLHHGPIVLEAQYEHQIVITYHDRDGSERIFRVPAGKLPPKDHVANEKLIFTQPILIRTIVSDHKVSPDFNPKYMPPKRIK